MEAVDDEELAYGLQIQEVLVSLINEPNRSRADGAGEQSELPVTSPDILEKDTYADAICRAGLQKNTYFRASCGAVLELFNRWWYGVRQDGRDGKIGESSGVHQEDEEFFDAESGDEFFCDICMDWKPMAECFGINPCAHAFCSYCISQYIAAKVEENMTAIGCPDAGCKYGVLEPEECREILPQAVFDRWGLALCEFAIGTQKFYCPFKDCSGLLIDDGGNGDERVPTNAECPHCHRMFCAQCKVPWHEGIDCAAFQQLGDDERGRDDIAVRKMAIDGKWQRCPQCKVYVERIEGCVFMKCRCGHYFCYLCASPMSIESHFCQKCRRIW